MAVKKKMAPDVAKAYLAPYNSWQNRIAIYRFVRDIPLQSQHKSYAILVAIENRLAMLRDSAVPLLIIWGGGDFCFNEVFFKEWIRRFPDAENHYFPDGGHYILEDKLDRYPAYYKIVFSSLRMREYQVAINIAETFVGAAKKQGERTGGY